MKAFEVTEQELLPFECGSINSPFDESDFALKEAEKTFLSTYDELFTLIGKFVSIVESGDSADADVAMSKWVDPTRVFPVVVRRFSPGLKCLIPAVIEFLQKHPLCSVLFYKSPLKIVVLPDCVLVSENVPIDLLDEFGLKK